MRLQGLFLVLTVMIDAMGIGLIVPVMPDLIQEVGGGTLAEAAIWGGILTTSFAVMQFLFGPAVGNLSDRYGRRPILIFSLIILALDYVVMAVASALWVLLIGRLIGGITAATQATAHAAMSDISEPSRRAANFGLIGAGFGIGFVLGPLIGGVFGDYGTRAPFWAAAILASANALFGWVVLKETVTDENRRPFNWRRANPLGALQQLRLLPGVTSLMLVYFLYHISFSAYPSVWAYFVNAQFDWRPSMIGISLGLFGLSMAVIQAGLIRPILARLGEGGAVILGHLFAIGTYTGIALIADGFTVLVLTPIAALGGLIPPAIVAMMSRRVAENAQGELQGALSSVAALAMVVSPLMMTWFFAKFTDPESSVILPGAPYLLAATLSTAALGVFLVVRRHRTDQG